MRSQRSNAGPVAPISRNPYIASMIKAVDIVKASLRAGWAALCPKQDSDGHDADAQTLVPIRSLGPHQCHRIGAHLLSLNAADRYLRFGYAVQDAQILHYVDGLNFERDEVLGIFDRKLTLLAVAHLAYGQTYRSRGCAEFGVSVISRARGRGYGAGLFDCAAMHAVNQGVDTLLIHALTENIAMLNIARAAGARVVRDGAESEAYLELPQATLNSRIAEIVQANVADMDYRLKRQAKLLRDSLTT